MGAGSTPRRGDTRGAGGPRTHTSDRARPRTTCMVRLYVPSDPPARLPARLFASVECVLLLQLILRELTHGTSMQRHRCGTAAAGDWALRVGLPCRLRAAIARVAFGAAVLYNLWKCNVFGLRLLPLHKF
jgi:hypothetical protein